MKVPPEGIVDTLIGFRAQRLIKEVPALRASDRANPHPHNYMFHEIPPQLQSDEDPAAAIRETIDLMEKFGIQVGALSLSDDRVPQVLREYPNRFIGVLPVDGNRGMDQVREIIKAYDQHKIRAVSTFPAGVSPQIPINDKLWYPIYAKCIELDIPVFVTTGVPGPRVKMKPQYVGYLDEVCYDFPELKIIMRHGAEPWENLAVKLMLKWPNLYYSTSGFAPKYIPKAIIDYANSRGADKVIYAGYYPFGLTLDRIFAELNELPLHEDVWPKFLSQNARKLLKLPV